MRILIVSQWFYPEEFLINDIAKELVCKGHDVTVLTGLPTYPSNEFYKQYKSKHIRNENVNGINIIRVYEAKKKDSIIGLFLNYMSYAINGYIKCAFMKKNSYDIIFCYQPSPVTIGIPAIKAKKRQKTKLILYCCDIFPESVKSHVKSTKSILYKLIAHESKRIYSKCDKILVTSPSFIEYIHDINNISYDKMVYLPQHASDEMLNIDLQKKPNGYVDFMFAGNVGYGQNIETIVKAAAILKHENVKIHIVGDGSRLQYIKKMVNEYQLNNIFVFYGRVSRNEMSKIYKEADCLLITLRGNNFVGRTIPSKLQTYMTLGKPILGSISGDAKKVIEVSQSGLCVEAGDYQGLANIMTKYIENLDSFSEYGINAKKYFLQNFTLEKYIFNLEEEMLKYYKH